MSNSFQTYPTHAVYTITRRYRSICFAPYFSFDWRETYERKKKKKPS